MDEVEQQLLLEACDELTGWADLLSFYEIRSNDKLVRSVERLERLLGKRPVIYGED